MDIATLQLGECHAFTAQRHVKNNKNEYFFFFLLFKVS